MARVELAARVRAERGKNAARRLRKNGFIPGNLIVFKSDSIALAISQRDIENFLIHNASSTIIDFTIDNEGKDIKKSVLLREVQRDPITHGLVHLDLQEISMDKEIQVRIPLRLTSDPVGVTEEGGILYQSVNEVEVICLPSNIPDSITIDVKNLGLHQHVNISDIEIVGDYKVLADQNTTIATVLPPRVIQEDTPEIGEEEAIDGTEEGEGEEAAVQPE